jgi:hypothetical protein
VLYGVNIVARMIVLEIIISTLQRCALTSSFIMVSIASDHWRLCLTTHPTQIKIGHEEWHLQSNQKRSVVDASQWRKRSKRTPSYNYKKYCTSSVDPLKYNGRTWRRHLQSNQSEHTHRRFEPYGTYVQYQTLLGPRGEACWPLARPPTDTHKIHHKKNCMKEEDILFSSFSLFSLVGQFISSITAFSPFSK